MKIEDYIISDLSKHPELYNDVLNLIEQEFKYSNENKFRIDFAPLVDPINFHNCLIILNRESKKVVSHLAFNKRTMVMNGVELKITLIGGIVTDPNYRGRGFFKKLLNESVAKNIESGLIILWSEINNLYEKFNFYRAGGLIESGKNVITKENIPDNFSKTTFDKIGQKDFSQIISIYKSQIESQHFTLKREDINWSIIKSMSSVDIYIERDENQNIIRYFCVGKGRDIPGIIHECSFLNDPKALEKILSFKTWLPETFLSKFENVQLNYNAFMRIENIDELNHFFHQLKTELKIHSLLNNEVRFSFLGKSHKATVEDFTRYVFGPNPLEEFFPFNLSPYISGLDSV
jgi:GNAT superfamily N-acetyltransferase